MEKRMECMVARTEWQESKRKRKEERERRADDT